MSPPPTPEESSNESDESSRKRDRSSSSDSKSNVKKTKVVDPLLEKIEVEIKSILSTADLTQLTTRIVRKSLEKTFNTDLHQHKSFIKTTVSVVLAEMESNATTDPVKLEDISKQLLDDGTEEGELIRLFEILSSVSI